MYKKKRIIYSISPLIIFILKMIILIPVNISGGVAGVNYIARIDLFTILKNKYFCTNCVDTFNYDILFSTYLIEGALVLLISIIIVYIIYRIDKHITR